MKTKSKVASGISFLFILIVAMGCAGIYFVTILSKDSSDIIKDNLVSLDYMQSIGNKVSVLNNMAAQNNFIHPEALLDSIEKKIKSESENITENGEKSSSDSLRANFDEYKNYILNWKTHPDSTGLYASGDKIFKSLNNIYWLNHNAIVNKSNKASQTSAKAIAYISIIGTVFFLLSFVFITNFPGYIANPIREISEKIRLIADGDFNQRLILDDRKDEFGMVASSFNYLARKLQEFRESNIAEVTRQKSRIESVVNNMDEAIVMLDENLDVVVVNPQAAELMGLANEALAGKPAQAIAQKNDLFKALTKDLAGNSGDKSPLRITLDNEENYFQKYVHLIENYDEWKQETRPGGYLIVLKNITEFKKLDMAKTNFIATLSHELKTPLSSINLSLKLIQDERIGHLTSEQVQLIDNIRHETQRLLSYVNELLDYSQIETGNIKLNITQARAGEIINLSLEAMKPSFMQKNLHSEVIMADNFLAVKADVEKTVWVMTNLLSNAVRFSPEGGKITISAARHGDVVQFSVKDQGPGIDPQYHDKIFERFVQVYSNGNKGGTGLGLAIAKDFIKAQGGSIYVESEPGEGSKFIFELPAGY